MKNNKYFVVVEIIEPTDSNEQHINVLLRTKWSDGQVAGNSRIRVYHETVGHLVSDGEYVMVKYYYNQNRSLGIFRGIELDNIHLSTFNI